MTTATLDLARENGGGLRQQLREKPKSLLRPDAHGGLVDALAIQGSDGPRIFTLESADHG
ncbi:MAG: hypothetical protein WKG07_31750 [Hymenobacter sp.]